ncbi:MAG TPA: OmpW family outer membrane protein [Geobacteraceae bacterium]
MKRTLVTVCLTAVLSLVAGVAGAENIAGKFGITGRIGFLVPSDMEVISGRGLINIGTDVGLNGGGGFIYGINNNLAAELEVTHSTFGTDGAIIGIGDASITDVALGLQYRFAERQHLVPYAGAGASILINDLDSNDGVQRDVDVVAGAYAKGGVDYFLVPAVALNAEIKATLAPSADINIGDAKVGNFIASNFAGSIGIRLFFP